MIIVIEPYEQEGCQKQIFCSDYGDFFLLVGLVAHLKRLSGIPYAGFLGFRIIPPWLDWTFEDLEKYSVIAESHCHQYKYLMYSNSIEVEEFSEQIYYKHV